MNEQASDQASDAQKIPANGMEMHDRNVDAIAAFIESGCTADEGALGVELEYAVNGCVAVDLLGLEARFDVLRIVADYFDVQHFDYSLLFKILCIV